ncbi:response regulator [Phototrophicus methaneseepsis]|uniref:Response regulator n=1 Tax=Phototrophicus methaneseepsis TaxID=2710758 RepID=A0A7S8EBK5_9CHLR|nr:response regulator [Phototrophicus methaneseepsis]QPC83904.1 response regulator [Phototrophicus methaneseepsis]
MEDISNWDVIIVDDEPSNLGVAELVLEHYGATVRLAESGEKCLQLLKEGQQPTVMLIDIQMPEMSGFELLDKVREKDVWQNIPAIAVTAHAMEEDKRRILAAGFNGHLRKPINVVTFVDEIMEIVTQ